MKKIILFVVICSLFLFAIATPLYAFTSKSGESVNLTTDESDDIYAFGKNVLVSSKITGDLVAAGGKIDLTGEVTQDLINAGGYLNIGGKIGDDVKAAGGVITISGTINDDLVIAGGQITIDKGAKIGGDVVVSGGMLTVNGEIAGKLVVSSDTVEITGKISKDVEINTASSVKVASGAEIGGNFNYTSSKEAEISKDAKISGKINYTPIKVEAKAPKNKALIGIPLGIFGATYIGGEVVSFLSMFVLGILLILVVPIIFKKFNSRMRSSLGRCVGGGAIMLFGIPAGILILWFICALLMLTVVGIGIGLLGFCSTFIIAALYFILIYCSTVFLSFFIGELILSKTKINLSKYGWKVLAYLIGLAIVMLIYAIPFVGWIVQLAGILFGFGGLVMLLKDWIWGFKKAKNSI
jgi:hypothetical protein